jgi:hypothetical protein
LCIDEGLRGVEVTVGAVLVAGVAHLVIHEVGHLLAALVTGLRVTSVRITFWPGRQSMVVVRPDPSSVALPIRMMAFACGGPLANLGGAALTYRLASGSVPALARYALMVATLIGVTVGVVNLLPHRNPSGLPSDGLLALRWTLNSVQARADLERCRQAEHRTRAMRAIAGNHPDGVRVDDIGTATGDPLVLVTAFERRWLTATVEDNDQIIAEAERLSAIAHDERTDPVHGGLIAGRLATIFGTWYLYAAIVDGQPVGRTDTDEIIEIGELAVRLLPENVHARIGLAIVRLLDHRPADARDLLLDVHATDAQPDAGMLAMQVRAAAEIYLGDLAQADQLIAAAGTGNLAMRQILTTLLGSARRADPQRTKAT